MTARMPLAGRRVLIAEDRYLIAAELAHEVERLGGEVVGPFRDVSAAVGLVARERVDLALLDVNLDGALVYPLARALDSKGVPFLFLTGYDENVLPHEWRSRPRLSKPMDKRALRGALARIAPAR